MSHRPSIRLNSGNHFFFDHPASSTYTIEDVAHNLCKEPRFNGATKGFGIYSVAQHAVNASLIVAPAFAREALHHDDPEAFYKDVTTWLKGMCPDYKRELARGEVQHAERLGLPLTMSPEVKLADRMMLKMEKVALFDRHATEEGFEFLDDIDTAGYEQLVDLTEWSPRYAYKRYIDRHNELEALR